jgi:four helix bundle protein
MEQKIQSYRELIVWQKSFQVVLLIYKLTKSFPPEEIYGLTSQMRRAAVSIPSNIAEGRSRATRKEFVQFLRVAFASGAELETQLEISQALSFGQGTHYNEIKEQLSEVMKMLRSIINKLAS